MSPPRTIPALIALALALAGCSASPEPDNQRCLAHTSTGDIAGVEKTGLCVFRGIRYAAPPTGELRFRPPQPPPAWTGTLRADDGSRVCPQVRSSSEEFPDDRKVFGDEDCLRLNVWTPAPGKSNRPVIVFVHGGAARIGTANEPRYAGDALARVGDAVVVTINYRLGVLGWSELGRLDPALRGSGNNGLRDQIAALEWVRTNIAAFGGDPANVTAMGESAGAFSLSALLATDRPERLFRRAVLQSGSGYLVHPRPGPPPPIGDLAALRSLPAADLVTRQEATLDRIAPGTTSAVYFGPSVDGTLVLDTPERRLAEGHARGVDLLLGTTRDEVNFFGQFGPDPAAGLAAVAEDQARFFPAALRDRRAEIAAVYRRDRSPTDATLAMFSDQVMRLPAIRMAEAQARWRPTYLYEFAWSPPGGLGAVHTAELPFVFGTLRFVGVPGGAAALSGDRATLEGLSDRMVRAWTAFARTGNPDWPSYRPPTRTTRIWDVRGPDVLDDPRRAEREAWPALPDALELRASGK